MEDKTIEEARGVGNWGRAAITDQAWWKARGEELAGQDRSGLIERFQVPSEQRIARATERKVGFLVAGTAKGGTTALDSYLRLHPKICMPFKLKEVNFFSTAELFSFGEPDYRLYHAFFRPKKVHCILGDVSPDYMFSEKAPRRVHDYNPEMKIVLSLRDPIDRAFSHWNMNRALGFEPLPFSEAIHGEEERARAGQEGEETLRILYVAKGILPRPGPPARALLRPSPNAHNRAGAAAR